MSNTLVQNGVKELYDNLKKISFEGTIEIKKSWFSNSSFSIFFDKILKSESFNFDIENYTNLSAYGETFSITGTSTLPLIGDVKMLLKINHDHQSKNTTIDASIETLSEKQITFKEIAGSFGLNIHGFPDIEISKLDMKAGITNKSVDISAIFKSNLEITIAGNKFEIENTHMNISYADNEYSGSIHGMFSLDNVSFSVNASSQSHGWEFTCKSDDTVELDSIITVLLHKSGLSIDSSLPSIQLKDTSIQWNTSGEGFNIAAKIESDSKINLGVTSLTLKGLDFDITHSEGKTTGNIKGSTDIGQIKIDVNYDLSKGAIIDADLGTVNISRIAETLCGENLLDKIGLPSGFPDFELKNCKLQLSAQDSSAIISSDLEGYGMSVFELKKVDGKWGFIFAAVIDDDFKFQKIAGFLKPIDSFNFSDSALVVSTINADKFQVPGKPDLSGEVTKGLNFLMNLSMNDCSELEQIQKILHLHIYVLKIHLAVGADGSALMEGMFDGSFSLVEGVTLTKTGLRVRLQSGNLIFSLVVAVSVDIGDKLLFTGEMAVQPNGASLAATMQGEWHKPFGVNGLTLSDVALAVGISGQGIPTVGIAGSVEVKNLEGELAVLFNSQAPQQSALKLAFNEFYVKTVLELCDENILDAIPDKLEVVLDSGYKDVEIYVVPTTTQIGELKYEQGFRAKGSVDLLGWDAMTDMEIDPSNGITAIGKMDPISLGSIFKLEGAEDKKNPQFELDLNLKKQKAIIAGSVSFLGLNKYSIFADISPQGAVFSIYQKIYNVIELALNDCNLNKTGFKAAGNIKFGIDKIGPVKVAGITILDKINLNTNLNMSASINIDNNFSMKLNGSLKVLGHSLPSIDFSINVAPSDFKDVLYSLIKEIEKMLGDSFNKIWKDIEEWANSIKDGVVEFSGDVASVAKHAFNASEHAAVAAYKVLDKGADEIAHGLKDTYKLGDHAVAGILKGAGFTANEVASALKSAYGLGDKAVTAVLKGVGYSANEIAGALKSVYGLGGDAVAGILKGAGYSIGVVGGVLKGTFNYSTKQAGKVLQGAGYAANQIKDWGGDAIDWIGGAGKAVEKVAKKIFKGW